MTTFTYKILGNFLNMHYSCILSNLQYEMQPSRHHCITLHSSNITILPHTRAAAKCVSVRLTVVGVAGQLKWLGRSCCSPGTTAQCSPAGQWRNASARKWDDSSETESRRRRPCSYAASAPHSNYDNTTSLPDM